MACQAASQLPPRIVSNDEIPRRRHPAQQFTSFPWRFGQLFLWSSGSSAYFDGRHEAAAEEWIEPVRQVGVARVEHHEVEFVELQGEAKRIGYPDVQVHGRESKISDDVPDDLLTIVVPTDQKPDLAEAVTQHHRAHIAAGHQSRY